MAEQLTLFGFAGSVSVSVISASGLNILYDGGTEQRAVDPQTRVIETYRCKVTGTSDNDLASQLITLDRILENASRYDRDSTEENEIWLIDQLQFETNPRYSLVLGGTWNYDINPHSTPTRTEHTAFITLALKRMPTYEAGTFNGPILTGAIVTVNSVSVFGGKIDLASVAKGDAPARIMLFLNGNTGTIERVWTGFRSIRKHAVSETDLSQDYFEPIWEAELGTMGTNTATTTSYDATSTGSTPKAIIVSFANANWDERVVVTANQVAGVYDDRQTGRFLVLGRMRLDTGTDTVQVRLRSGWRSTVVTPQYKTLDPVTVSGTSYQYYELGTVKFPPSQGLETYFGVTAMHNAALSLLAARTSGSTSKLVIDHFAMVPVDEGFAKISGASLATSSNMALITSSPNNRPLSAYYDDGATGLTSSLSSTQQDFFMPFNSSSLYIFGQRSGVSTIGDLLDTICQVWPRYLSLRGNG